MNKLLLVGDSPVTGRALMAVLRVFGVVDLRMTPCQGSVSALQEYEPTHVLFFDYNEERGVSGICWFELQHYRSPGLKMARMGLPHYSYPDYIHLFEVGLPGILQFLGVTGKAE